jgi:hypothetical protein
MRQAEMKQEIHQMSEARVKAVRLFDLDVGTEWQKNMLRPSQKPGIA